MQYSLSLDRVCKLIRVVGILVIILLAYYISSNWYQLSLIRGNSMIPAYHNMQFILIDKHSGEYTYGDVITFQCDNLNSVLVKRVIACPGDQVIILNDVLYVNDAVSEIFPEKYVFEYAGIAENSVSLDEKQYFVIGDNFAESKDSRYEEIGIVCEDDVLGKVIPQIANN